ncbi:MAG: SUMF1/EgtB/PvdO family nonheme iron enzyme [Leptolyngbya sp.]|nr:SUMF1/EgtB/PvdO family nonheme iron enzyme [Leptolyngbya sp.]
MVYRNGMPSFAPRLVMVLCVALLFAAPVRGALITVETVAVGDAGNAADGNGKGSVAYDFAVGKYEVTIAQYSTFLNSVAAVTSDSYIIDLYNLQMFQDNDIAGILRSGSGTSLDPYSYSVVGPSGSNPAGASSPGDRPIAYVSWFDAARFANWVNNGATNGASTETGAYTLNGATNGIIAQNAGATWWLPTWDEWYKAAFYKGGSTNAGYWDYATQSDAAPGNTIGSGTNQANYAIFNGTNFTYSVTQATNKAAGQNYLSDVGAFTSSDSAYGTFDQSGNLAEWVEATFSATNRVYVGGSWKGGLPSASTSVADLPTTELDSLGFRLATTAVEVPEPGTWAAASLLGLVAFIARSRRRAG